MVYIGAPLVSIHRITKDVQSSVQNHSINFEIFAWVADIRFSWLEGFNSLDIACFFSWRIATSPVRVDLYSLSGLISQVATTRTLWPYNYTVIPDVSSYNVALLPMITATRSHESFAETLVLAAASTGSCSPPNAAFWTTIVADSSASVLVVTVAHNESFYEYNSIPYFSRLDLS